MLLALVLLQKDSRVAPTLALQIEGQSVEQQPIALFGVIDVSLDGQVLELHGRTIGKRRVQLRRIQTQHGTLQPLLAPARPQLAACLHRMQIPVGSQASWQP